MTTKKCKKIKKLIENFSKNSVLIIESKQKNESGMCHMK